jgi:ketosteroid isomerase-like protein
MTPDEMKQKAKELVLSAGQGDIDAVAAMISDDFTLEQMVREGQGDYSAAGARYDRDTYLGFLAVVKQLTRAGMNMRFDKALAEGDEVALFGNSDALSPSGRLYRNAYCWLIRFRDGKAVSMQEYYDTALGSALLEG